MSYTIPKTLSTKSNHGKRPRSAATRALKFESCRITTSRPVPPVGPQGNLAAGLGKCFEKWDKIVIWPAHLTASDGRRGGAGSGGAKRSQCGCAAVKPSKTSISAAACLRHQPLPLPQMEIHR